MIEQVYGIEPHGDSDHPSPVGGVVLVQYDEHGGDIAVGITLDRKGLERYLETTEAPSDGLLEQPIQMYVRMERPATNRLIGLLRKARNTTFGEDI